MFTLYLIREEEEPYPLKLGYTSYSEALTAKVKLEEVYGQGTIEVDQAQEYQARMGRY